MGNVFIECKFPSLNDYVGAERKNRFLGAKMKRQYTDLAAEHFNNLETISEPVKFHFTWYEKNSRRDPDNIIFAKKFILDGMVSSGVLPNDNQKWITGITDEWKINKERPGVEISWEKGS